VEPVRFRILQEEIAEEAPAKETARLGRTRFPGFPVGVELVRLEDPFRHLLVRGWREVDPASGRFGVRILRERHRPDPRLVQVIQEFSEPPLSVDPFRGSRPEPELFPVIPEDRDPPPLPDPGEDPVDLLQSAEGDQVPEALVDGKDPHREPFVLGDVGCVDVLCAGVMEVFLVEKRVFDPGPGQGPGDVRLPDPLGQPHAPRPAAEMLLEIAAHHPELSEPVLLRDDGVDRLVEPAAEELDLSAPREAPDKVPAVPAAEFHVLQQRAGKMKSELEVRVLVELGEERLVTFVERPFEDVVEIAHRLMAVDGEEEPEGAQGRPPCPALRRAART
jgi:hypothetical protein